MPFGDRTGPRGFGPMTGRAAGYCAGYAMPGYANPGPGYGLGWGGGGWRHRRWFRATGLPRWRRGFGPQPFPFDPWEAPLGKEQEATLLESQADWLRQQLEALGARIAELRQGAGDAKDQEG